MSSEVVSLLMRGTEAAGVEAEPVQLSGGNDPPAAESCGGVVVVLRYGV